MSTELPSLGPLSPQRGRPSQTTPRPRKNAIDHGEKIKEKPHKPIYQPTRAPSTDPILPISTELPSLGPLLPQRGRPSQTTPRPRKNAIDHGEKIKEMPHKPTYQPTHAPSAGPTPRTPAGLPSVGPLSPERGQPSQPTQRLPEMKKIIKAIK